MDPNGWVRIEAFLRAVGEKYPEWARLSKNDLLLMIQHSDKRRHEISGGRIRALYGHSIAERLAKTPGNPPNYLYHGTDAIAADRILADGLKPMQRQYVHLSIDINTARQVGRRKTSRPVILRINAKDAHEHGARFYEGNESVWLADEIPSSFISRSG
jgi:putative RNA 2'-phosphotransferase